MRRWVVGIVVLILVVVAAGAVWRGYQLNRELDGAKDDLLVSQAASETFEETVHARETEIETNANRIQELEKSLTKMRREKNSRQRCDYLPRLILTPSSGPSGTRVTFKGYCFVGDWGTEHFERFDFNPRTTGYGLFVTNPVAGLPDPPGALDGGPNCELIGETRPNDLVVRPNGRAHGYFTMPSSGVCFQEDRGASVSPGKYKIGLLCHTCSPLAVFRVTE